MDSTAAPTPQPAAQLSPSPCTPKTLEKPPFCSNVSVWPGPQTRALQGRRAELRRPRGGGGVCGGVMNRRPPTRFLHLWHLVPGPSPCHVPHRAGALGKQLELRPGQGPRGCRLPRWRILSGDPAAEPPAGTAARLPARPEGPGLVCSRKVRLAGAQADPELGVLTCPPRHWRNIQMERRCTQLCWRGSQQMELPSFPTCALAGSRDRLCLRWSLSLAQLHRPCL